MNEIDFSKITIALAIAFGLVVDGDYLFQVIINEYDARILTQDQIFELTRQDDIVIVDLDRRIDTRRWHDRFTNRDRRKASKSYGPDKNE